MKTKLYKKIVSGLLALITVITTFIGYGSAVFAGESGIFTTNGAGYISETYVDARKNKLSKIAYYGYTNTSMSYLPY